MIYIGIVRGENALRVELEPVCCNTDCYGTSAELEHELFAVAVRYATASLDVDFILEVHLIFYCWDTALREHSLIFCLIVIVVDRRTLPHPKIPNIIKNSIKIPSSTSIQIFPIFPAGDNLLDGQKCRTHTIRPTRYLDTF